ncbi:MAG: methyltransferase domain-containing protein [Hyphomicrobiales bacterium]|nr:methyltransferase domain-containing protein [Hyphomicrobiales bacterium]MCP5370209.1 methyltransferase domain-containing protein [Hyphomicrobiales bacterium]
MTAPGGHSRGLAAEWAVVRRRRRALAAHFDVARQFEEIEESCVPSYVHGNLAAAAVSWWRLILAARLFRAQAARLGVAPGPVLDFGAASGELSHFLGPGVPYHFVEQDDLLAGALAAFVPGARREDAAALPPGRFAAVFALDSLEHNDDVGALLDLLRDTLRADGLLVLSGPTENALYRLGRRLAGFSGHYHTTTIGDIERLTAQRFTREARRLVPLALLPLFSVSVWRRDG